MSHFWYNRPLWYVWTLKSKVLKHEQIIILYLWSWYQKPDSPSIFLICRLAGAKPLFLIEMHTFLFKKMHLKMSSWNWRPSCLGPNVLRVKSSLIRRLSGIQRNGLYHIYSMLFSKHSPVIQSHNCISAGTSGNIKQTFWRYGLMCLTPSCTFLW